MFGIFDSPLIATLIALTGGYIFVRHQIQKQRKLQQETLSIQEVQRLWRDESFQTDIIAVMKIGREEDIAQYAEDRQHAPVSEEWEKKRALIVRSINYFEMISVGVYVGIYDPNIIKLTIKSTILGFYDNTEPFIKKIREEIRKKHPKIEDVATEFENFAKRLKDL